MALILALAPALQSPFALSSGAKTELEHLGDGGRRSGKLLLKEMCGCQ